MPKPAVNLGELVLVQTIGLVRAMAEYYCPRGPKYLEIDLWRTLAAELKVKANAAERELKKQKTPPRG